LGNPRSDQWSGTSGCDVRLGCSYCAGPDRLRVAEARCRSPPPPPLDVVPAAPPPAYAAAGLSAELLPFILWFGLIAIGLTISGQSGRPNSPA
jgi:hypothetical protein